MLTRVYAARNFDNEELFQVTKASKLGKRMRQLGKEGDAAAAPLARQVEEQLKDFVTARKDRKRKRPAPGAASGSDARRSVPRTSGGDAASSASAAGAFAGFGKLASGFAGASAPAPAEPPAPAPAPPSTSGSGSGGNALPRVPEAAAAAAASDAAASQAASSRPRPSAAAAAAPVKGILVRKGSGSGGGGGGEAKAKTYFVKWGDGKGDKSSKDRKDLSAGTGLTDVRLFDARLPPEAVTREKSGDLSDLRTGDGSHANFTALRRAEGGLGEAKLEKAAAGEAALMVPLQVYVPPRPLALPGEEGQVAAPAVTPEAAAQEQRLSSLFRDPTASQTSTKNNAGLPADPAMDQGEMWLGFRADHTPREMRASPAARVVSLADLGEYLKQPAPAAAPTTAEPSPAAAPPAPVPVAPLPSQHNPLYARNASQFAALQARAGGGGFGHTARPGTSLLGAPTH